MSGSLEYAQGLIESREDYKNTPVGQYKYWNEELTASKEQRRNWHKQASRIVKRYVDYRRDNEGGYKDTTALSAFRLNLFHSNINTLKSMLYGNLPTVDVSRRYADANDDVSRVASEIMERLLNNDIAENGEEYNTVLRSTLEDRLLAGLGVARVRYEVETELAVNEMGVEEESVVFEDAPVDYFHWRDILWGWGRTWSEIPWLAYRVWMTKDEVKERFGEKVADKLEYKKQLVSANDELMEDPETGSVWNKAEVWEIWDKTKRKVIFYSHGYNKIIETKDDPLGLTGFFPSPPFFIANSTTSLYTPTPDFHITQDLYNEVDKLQTRIAIITEAVKVVGVYNAESEGVSRMFKEGTDNTLIPVSNWALWGEKGGNQGQIDWLPLMDIVGALDKLRELRDDTISLLHQVTGMADVMRGQGAGQYESSGQAQMKAKMSSIRVQALQDEFATFAGDIMQLKAEVIALHFSPETIAQRSNIGESFDADKAPEAIELIKNTKKARLKIKVRPESVAMVDYAQLKLERTDYINALATFMQSASPLIEQDQSVTPFLLQLLQWGLAGFKGASEIEGVIDKAIEQATQNMQNPKPDPAAEAAQKQQEMAMQLEQMKQQAKLAEIQAKAEADARIREMDMQADIATAMAQHQAKIAEIEAEMQAALAETKAKLEADILVEGVQTQANIGQTNAAAQSEIGKDVVETELRLQEEAAKTSLKINEIAASSAAKIREAEQKPTDSDND
jgi:hypothetical protein